MKQFLNNIKDSIFNPEYYREIYGKPFSYSLKYFFSFALTLAVVGSLFLSFSLIPVVKTFVKTAGDKIIAYYPEELQIDVRKGFATTNVKEPYSVPFPQELKVKEFSLFFGQKNLLVIDTARDITVNEFKELDTLAFLTRDSIFFQDERGKITIQSLNQIPDVKINRAGIAAVYNKIKPFFNIFPPIIALGLFFMIIIVLIFKLSYLIIGGLVIWFVARARKMQIPYEKAYQLGLHLMTMGILVDAVLFLLQIRIPIPFRFTIILIIMTILNLRSEYFQPVKSEMPAESVNTPLLD